MPLAGLPDRWLTKKNILEHWHLLRRTSKSCLSSELQEAICDFFLIERTSSEVFILQAAKSNWKTVDTVALRLDIWGLFGCLYFLDGLGGVL